MIYLVTANIKISSGRKILSGKWHVTLIPSFLQSVTCIQSSSYWKHWHASPRRCESIVWGNHCTFTEPWYLIQIRQHHVTEKLNFKTKGKKCGNKHYKMYRVQTGGRERVYRIHKLWFSCVEKLISSRIHKMEKSFWTLSLFFWITMWELRQFMWQSGRTWRGGQVLLF